MSNNISWVPKVLFMCLIGLSEAVWNVIAHERKHGTETRRKSGINFWLKTAGCKHWRIDIKVKMHTLIWDWESLYDEVRTRALWLPTAEHPVWTLVQHLEEQNDKKLQSENKLIIRWSQWAGSGGSPQVPGWAPTPVEALKPASGGPGRTPDYSQSPWRTWTPMMD